MDGASQELRIVFLVPEHLLWNAEGMAEIYTSTRAAYFGDGPFDANTQEAYEGWHVVSIDAGRDTNDGFGFVLEPEEEPDLPQSS